MWRKITAPILVELHIGANLHQNAGLDRRGETT